MTIVYQSILNGYPGGLTNAPARAVRGLAKLAEGRSLADYKSHVEGLKSEIESLEAVGHGGSDSDLDLYLLKCGDHECYDIAIHDITVEPGTDSVIGHLLVDEQFIPGAVIQCALYDYAIEGLEIERLQDRIDSEFRRAIDPDVTEDQAKAIIADLRVSGSGIFGVSISEKLFRYTGSSANFLALLPDTAVQLFTEIANEAYPAEEASNISSI